MILYFDVYNQKVIRVDDEYTVNLSHDYLECDFMFHTTDWDDVTKYVTFTVKGRSYRYELDGNDMVRVPNDILKYKYFYLKLHGVSKTNQTVITTDEIIILMKITGYSGNLTESTDINSKDVVTLLKEKLATKIDHFQLTDTNLICYSEDKVVQIIPFTFLNNYYDKTTIDELLSRTIVDVDTSELADTGYLIFEKHDLET